MGYIRHLSGQCAVEESNRWQRETSIDLCTHHCCDAPLVTGWETRGFPLQLAGSTLEDLSHSGRRRHGRGTPDCRQALGGRPRLVAGRQVDCYGTVPAEWSVKRKPRGLL